jgi:WD40 repeat protein
LRNCALSPDSKTLLAGVNREVAPGSGELRLWNVSDGARIRGSALDGAHAEFVRFAPDGKSVVTICGDAMAVRHWPDGKRLHEFSQPEGELRGFTTLGSLRAISPDGKFLMTTVRHVHLHGGSVIDAAGGSLDLWDAEGGRHLRQLARIDSMGVRAAFTADNQLNITSDAPLVGEEDRQRFPHGVVHTFDPGTGRVKRMFGAPNTVSALALSPDGRTMYLGSRDGTIHVCDAATGVHRFRLAGHHDQVTDLVLVPRGKLLVSTSWDGSALVWDIAAPTVQRP